ncbi:MAG: hypothetical protein WC933_00835 [Candidatus Paceibacterota bacterium]|jgi:hypothetical protein
MTTQESVNENPKERLSVPERNHFQGYLMEKMGVHRHSGHAEMEWAEAYGEKISNIIDNPSEKEIRSLIDDGWKTYQEADLSDSEEERQILTESWTSAYEKASEKIRKSLH